MRRLDWTFYPGIALLAAAVIQPFALPQQSRLWWPLVIAGLVLVAVSLIPWALGARSALGGRTVRYGFNTLVMVVLVLGIIGVVEALSYRHNARLDLTENRRHSLSSQTIQLLKGLPTKVNAVAFYRGDQPGKRLTEDLFKQYARYAGDKFTWKSVDPDREPTLAKAFGVEAYGTTVLEAKGRTEKVLDADQEEKLTNGLVKVTRDSKRVVYITQGHGEPEITNTERTGFSEAKGALDKANYEAKPLALARQGKVPDDASVVIIAGPRNDFFGPEIDALDAYLGRGGKLLAMINPPFPENEPGGVREEAARQVRLHARRGSGHRAQSDRAALRHRAPGADRAAVRVAPDHARHGRHHHAVPAHAQRRYGQHATRRRDAAGAGQDQRRIVGRDGPSGPGARAGQA